MPFNSMIGRSSANPPKQTPDDVSALTKEKLVGKPKQPKTTRGPSAKARKSR